MSKSFKVLLLHAFICSTAFSQVKESNNWELFSFDDVETIYITKTETHTVGNFTFEAIWDEKLSYSDNLGYYGGIKNLHVYKNNKKLQTIEKIEDFVALGQITFNFYDYNFDGYIDFTVPISCGGSCWDKYYIFNPKTDQFEHIEDWDYLRIQKVNKKEKMILSHPSGNALENNKVMYEVKGSRLIQKSKN